MKFRSVCVLALAAACFAPWRASVAQAAPERVLHSFQNNSSDGQSPQAGLLSAKGVLFGTTAVGGGGNCPLPSICGTVFSFDLATNTEEVLHSFCSKTNCTDGAAPGDLTESKGILYGTTGLGGNNYADCSQGGCGTVFSIDPTTGTETVIYAFCSQQNCADGSDPVGVVAVGGKLFGATEMNGAYSGGTLFSIDLATGAEQTIYSFGSAAGDAAAPYAGPIEVKGVFYGTTAFGGANRSGTVYSFDPHTGTESVLYSFCSQQNCSDGSVPAAGMVDVKGKFYGTTAWGGLAGCLETCGTVFMFNPQTGAEKVLHHFCSKTNCVDGSTPWAPLIYRNHRLYGTTELGGTGACQGPSNGCGTVFSVKP